MDYRMMYLVPLRHASYIYRGSSLIWRWTGTGFDQSVWIHSNPLTTVVPSRLRTMPWVVICFNKCGNSVTPQAV
eukprot:10291997-Karenia_brevis.AAC.1